MRNDPTFAECISVKYPKIHRCSLCGRRYAVLNSTWHISSSYRLRFCAECTTILEATVRKMKKAMSVDKYALDES